MKIKWILLLIFPLAIQSKAQSIFCNDSLSQKKYKKEISHLSDVLNEKMKLEQTLELAKANCLTTSQAIGFSKLFKREESRLKFLKTAYTGIRDKEKFYETFNTFSHFSFAFQLYDFIKEKQLEDSTILDAIQFPDFVYPDYKYYKGKTTCNLPVDEQKFKSLLMQIYKQSSSATKTAVANTLVSKNCISTAQAIKMAYLIKSDNNKSTFLENAYRYIYDKDNFGSAAQVFSDKRTKEGFMQWLDRAKEQKDLYKECKIETEQFDSIKTKIDAIALVQNKIDKAKKILKAGQCFSSEQIKTIVALFEFDSRKLEIAQFAYPYCDDQNNYYIVADAFQFSKGKNKLIKFVNSKK